MEDMFKELKKFRKEMDKAFKNFLEVPAMKPILSKGKELMEFRPAFSDVREGEKDVVVKMEIPGVDKKDIKLNIMDDKIEVKAERHHELEVDKKDLKHSERSYKGFYRMLPLPVDVDPNKSVAKYRDGVLEIKMPKLGLEHKKIKKLVQVK